MTVTVVNDVQVNTFSDAEIETVKDALRIADAHYRGLAELSAHSRGALNLGFRETFEEQARIASSLCLKIEAGR